MKLAFTKTLTRLAATDPRIVVLTADLGFEIFDDFIRQHGQRYVNVGVAEAEMMCAAAGLAHEGFRPFAYSIASFATARCWEQIKISIAYPQLPVTIVGAGGGYAYCCSGVTHHSGEDLGLMSLLPGMAIVAPGDANEVVQLLPQIVGLNRPCYFRIGRGKEAAYDGMEPPVLGKARLLRHGEDIAILSTGDMASEVMSALSILRQKGIMPSVFQYHTIRPFDEETLESITRQFKIIVVAEEHIPRGGLASEVQDRLMQWHFAGRLIRCTAPDRFILGSPTQEEMRDDCAINSRGIARRIIEEVVNAGRKD